VSLPVMVGFAAYHLWNNFFLPSHFCWWPYHCWKHSCRPLTMTLSGVFVSSCMSSIDCLHWRWLSHLGPSGD